jgi:hypothetical protein
MVVDMKAQLATVESKLCDLAAHVKSSGGLSGPPAAAQRSPHSSASTRPPTNVAPASVSMELGPGLASSTSTLPANGTVNPATTQRSWAEHLRSPPATAPTDADGFTTVMRSGRAKPQRKAVSGKRALVDGKIKTVPRRFLVFVSRLHKDTTVDDLAEMLKECGIEECGCVKLSDKGKDGHIFKSAAFMVTFDVRYQDIVYNETTWPAFAEVREWIFHPKKTSVGVPAGN